MLSCVDGSNLAPLLLLQFKVKVDSLLGARPPLTGQVSDTATPEETRPSALYVEGQLSAYGEVLGLPARTRYAEAAQRGPVGHLAILSCQGMVPVLWAGARLQN